MTVVEEEGRTPEEAVAGALEKLGLGREYVLVEILEEGTKGFLGLGGRHARVRLTVTPTGEKFLQGRLVVGEFLKFMGIEAEVRAQEVHGVLQLDIKGEDAGLLIGKQGQTLDAMNFLLSRVLRRRLGEPVGLQIDVEGYRERRRQLLVQRALKLAEQVKTTGEPVTLEPMVAADRRAIHLALGSDPLVRTSSQGEGPLRRIVISPVGRV